MIMEERVQNVTTLKGAPPEVPVPNVGSGSPGPPGPPGPTPGHIAAFTALGPSPIVLAPLAAGNIVSRLVVIIDVPFTDPTASVLVGVTGSPAMFMGPTDSVPTRANQYEVEDIEGIVLATNLILTVNPGASVVGSGRIYYEIQT